MKKRRLKTLADIRRWMADVGNRLEAGQVDVNFARCVSYMCSVMSGIIQTGDLEARIEKLEEQMEHKR